MTDAGGQQSVSSAISEDDTDAKVAGGGGAFGFFGKKDSQSDRKTVHFGDASAVRSRPLWSLISLLAILLFWFIATKPFGFPDDYKQVVDDRFNAAADAQIVKNAEREAAGNPNIAAIPSRTPLERDYLTACQENFNSTKNAVKDQQGDALDERFRTNDSIIAQAEAAAGASSGAAFDAALDRTVLDSVNAAVNAIAEDQAECSPSSYSQRVGPRTLPSPGDTFTQFNRLRTTGFQGTTLWEHAGTSLWRVVRGMFWGSLIGIPIGFAMGLGGRLRGLFDTPVELFRPIPPLALLPLFILWFGIGDGTAVKLLIFASVWIMIIAARAGARTVKLSKVRAAYALGASKPQVLLRVILPNALPELFTGFRVALGVSWGTLVAAELVGAETGLGSMIFLARNFLRTDVVVVGIIVIAVIGVTMDLIMRFAESKLIPWRGKG